MIALGNKILSGILIDENPIGSIVAYGGISLPPSNYVKCDGRELSREAYSELFAAIGTTYGSGDGSTTFNVPDLRDKILQGLGTRHSTLGESVGEELPNVKGGSISGSAAPYCVTDAVGTVGQWGMLKYSTPVAAWTDKTDGSNGRRWATIGLDLSKGQTNENGTSFKSVSVYKDGGHVQQDAVIINYYIKARKVYVEFSKCPHEVQGVVEYLDIGVNPNTLYAGTKWVKLANRYEWDDEGDLSSNGYSPLAPTDNGMRMYIRNNMVIVKIINMNVDNFNNDTVYLDDTHAKYRPGVDTFTQTGDYSSYTASGVFCIRATGKFTKFVTKSAGNLLLANMCYPCVNNPDRTFYRWLRVL